MSDKIRKEKKDAKVRGQVEEVRECREDVSRGGSNNRKKKSS